MTTENNSTPETNNKIAVIEKIKSFAFCLIGSVFTVLGFTYFQE